jgi:hypothetical protein
MRKIVSVGLTALAFLLTVPARAQNVAVAVPIYQEVHYGFWTLGFEFSPARDITVTALGSYFPAGATDAHDVALWDASQDVLAGATVTGTGTQGFAFTTITPIPLAAGQDYYIGGNLANDWFIEAGSEFHIAIHVPGQIDYIAHAEANCVSVTPCFPTNRYTSWGAFGGNFEFTAAPEPATWGMLILGAAMIGSTIRRRRAGPSLAA